MLADDHAATRLGVRLALQDGGMEVVAEAANAREAVAAVLEHRPDLCLLDVYMPGGGVAAAQQLSEAAPDVAIVMLSVSDEDADLFEALSAGARGYLLKDTPPQRLAHALAATLDGQAALPRDLTARLIGEFQRRAGTHRARDAAGALVSFSPRESEVIALLQSEMSTGQIAERLGISAVTVRRHISEITRKLKVADRASALRLIDDHER